MGDMADLAIEQMENGESIVLHVKSGERIVVDNMSLMYTNTYIEPEYKILGDYDGEYIPHPGVTTDLKKLK